MLANNLIIILRNRIEIGRWVPWRRKSRRERERGKEPLDIPYLRLIEAVNVNSRVFTIAYYYDNRSLR